MNTYYVYIMSNRWRTVLYIGVTRDLVRRVAEHKRHLHSGFSDHYNCTELMYLEDTPSIDAAIAREKQLKGWRRSKKEALIDTINPERRDLASGIV